MGAHGEGSERKIKSSRRASSSSRELKGQLESARKSASQPASLLRG